MEGQFLDKTDQAFFGNTETNHQGKHGEAHGHGDIHIGRRYDLEVEVTVARDPHSQFR